MNTEYLVWFGVLVLVTGVALVWLAIGEVPDIPSDPESASNPTSAPVAEGVPVP